MLSTLNLILIVVLAFTTSSISLKLGRDFPVTRNLKNHVSKPISTAKASYFNGEGQTFGDRAFKHSNNIKRSPTDPQIWTHIFFFVSYAICWKNRIWELAMLVGCTKILSLVYHFQYEKPGILAKVEGFSAKVLFAYGVAQIFNSVSPILTLVETFLMLLTSAVFIVTNIKKEFYDPWHCLMHVIPALWVSVVGMSHSPLIKL